MKTDIMWAMGFPDWTLWGMGLSALGAVIALSLSFIGQSPSFVRRAGPGATWLTSRARALTGYALALLLLAIGFFMAGVPLGQNTISQGDLPTALPSNTAETGNLDELVAADETGAEPISTPPATPATGAFAGPPVSTNESSNISLTPVTTIITPTERFTSTIAATAGPPTTEPATSLPTTATEVRPTPTLSPTPTATETPLPSLTPTPVLDVTAVISITGQTLWLRRSPGGQNIVLVENSERVLLQDLRANQGGILWRQVRTLDGISGWLPEEFIVLPQ